MHLGNCSIWNKEPQGVIIEHNLWSEASLILHVKQNWDDDWYRFSPVQSVIRLFYRNVSGILHLYKAKGLTT